MAKKTSIARTWTTCYSEGRLQVIEVEVLVRKGLPRFDIIGLPESMIREGRDRIQATLAVLGLDLGSSKILVNLNPGNLPKEGSHFDLPILAALMSALLPEIQFSERPFFWGELGLDGRIQSDGDLLPHILFAERHACSSHHASFKDTPLKSIQPYIKAPLFKLTNAADLLALSQNRILDESPHVETPHSFESWSMKAPEHSLWNHIRGSEQQFLFWALVALGRLHVLIEGPPGIGKSTWCLALRDLQRPLTFEAWSERLIFQSSRNAGSKSFDDISSPPFEHPHHSASRASIIGGGSSRIEIGALTRAHKGILFLDELPEFSRDILESLREPLEQRTISLARRGCTEVLPADIQLISTMNPCACGRTGSKETCHCGTRSYELYRARLSLPLRDRFHAHCLWTFVESKPHSNWSLKWTRHRINEAMSLEKIDFSQIYIPKDLSPRRQIRWLEFFTAWCRWFGLEKPSSYDAIKFTQFLEETKTNDADRPQRSDFRARTGNRVHGASHSRGDLVT